MTNIQDVFWTGFSDEVEKLAGKMGLLGKGLLAAGVVGGAAALGAGGKKVGDNAAKSIKQDIKAKNTRMSQQTGEDY